MITPSYSVEYLPATKLVGGEGAVLVYTVTLELPDAGDTPPVAVPWRNVIL